MNKKLQPVTRDGELIGYMFWCLGCESHHVFYTKGKKAWSFNGDLEKPTFSPSLVVWFDDPPGVERNRCHLFLKEGKIKYLSDCHHHLAGQTVDIPHYDSWRDEEEV